MGDVTGRANNLSPCDCAGAVCKLACNPIWLETGHYCRAIRPASPWQPIATAPKDGTVIDLGGLDWEGRWERWCEARWVSYDENWVGPWSDGCISGLPDERFRPTHWMLPPEPPR
jgi:hypothetical protein